MMLQVDSVLNYADALAESKDLQRRAVLEAAGRILTEKGPSALTMRNVAARIGASTSVLYTMFKNKDGLADALFIEGFNRLKQHFDTIPDDLSPLSRVLAIGRAYFENALSHPHYFGIMFLQVIPNYTPSDEASEYGMRTYGVLVQAVGKCIEAGDFPQEPPRLVSLSLTSAAHGVASLYLANRLRNLETGKPDPELARSVFDATFGDLVAGIQARRSPRAPKENV
jgi:AcrR family transcriptional regulator